MEELLGIHLGGGGHCASPQLGIESLFCHLSAAGNVVIHSSTHHIAERDDLDIQFLNKLWGQVRCRICDDAIISHTGLLSARFAHPIQLLLS